MIVDCVNKTAPVVPEITPYRMIRTTNVRNGRIDLSECRYVERATYEIWTRRAKLQIGDVVLTREAPIGEVGLVSEAEGVFLGQRLMQYRANTQVLNPRFLLYSFLSPELQHQFGSHEGSGSVVSHIRVGDCFKFKLRLPPLAIQKGIAELLGALDDRITLLRETNATLEAIAQALFKSWFVDFDPVRAKMEGRTPEGMDEATAALFPDGFETSELGEVPRGWRVGSVYDISKVIYGAPFASKLFKAAPPGRPLVRIRDLKDERPGVFTEENHPKGYLLKPGDIAVGMDGEFRAYIWGGETAWLNQRVCVFHPINGACSAFVRLSIAPLLAAVEASETATTVIHLGKSDIDRFRVILPSSTVLHAFAAVAESVYERLVLNKQKAQTLSTLRDTLLPRLISGQLRLPEAQAATEAALGGVLQA